MSPWMILYCALAAAWIVFFVGPAFVSWLKNPERPKRLPGDW